MCDNTNCDSERIAFLNGKTSDMCQFSYKDIDIVNGYVPRLAVIGDIGDYIEINFCLDCGKIQGDFPVSDEQVEKAVEKC